MKIFYKYINIILLNYFRILFVLSIIGKLIYPVIVQSYIISLFKYLEISYLFKFIESFYITYIIFVTLELIEALLIYWSFISYRKFLKGLFLFFLSASILSFIAFILKIPGDCGCFGKIISFENTFNKFVFNLFNLLLSSLFIFLTSTNVQTKTKNL